MSALATPHPDQGDKRAAKAECKALRGTAEATTEPFRGTDATSRDAFAFRYGTNGDTGRNGYRRNAFGKCVSTIAKAKEHAADVKDQQEASGWKSAAEECDAARDASAETFATTWGTDEDAFGKCVSRTAQENNGEESAPQS